MIARSKVPDEPLEAWVSQVQPDAVVGDEDQIGGEHRRIDQIGATRVGLRQDLHRVERQKEQCNPGHRPLGAVLEALEPSLRFHQSVTLDDVRVTLNCIAR
jgi:hypothetical protein